MLSLILRQDSEESHALFDKLSAHKTQFKNSVDLLIAHIFVPVTTQFQRSERKNPCLHRLIPTSYSNADPGTLAGTHSRCQSQTSGSATLCPSLACCWRHHEIPGKRNNGLAAPSSPFPPPHRPSRPEHRRTRTATSPASQSPVPASSPTARAEGPWHRHALRLRVGQRGPQGRVVRLRGPRRRRVLLPAAVSGRGRRSCRRRRRVVGVRLDPWPRAGRRGHQGRLRAVVLRHREPDSPGVRGGVRVRGPGGLLQRPAAVQAELHQLRLPAGEVRHEAHQMGGPPGADNCDTCTIPVPISRSVFVHPLLFGCRTSRSGTGVSAASCRSRGGPSSPLPGTRNTTSMMSRGRCAGTSRTGMSPRWHSCGRSSGPADGHGRNAKNGRTDRVAL